MSRGLKSAALLAEARALSADFDRLSQAVAERVGLSTTELLAMDLISRQDGVTAGQLARELSLTTGGVTGLLDRLHKAGLARRESDPNDRRRVFVRATAKEARIADHYRRLANDLRKAVDGYSEDDLAMLTEFLGRLRAAVGNSVEAVKRPG